jgi:ketosteroid isomerase-like protein
MKNLMFVFLLLMVSGFSPLQATSSRASYLPILAESCSTYVSMELKTDEEEVLEAEKRRFAAMVSKDFGALELLINDDLYYLHSNGKTDTKESFIEAIRNGSSSYDNITIDESQVRVYGSLGIINAKCTYYRKNKKGENNNLRLHYTSAYAYLDDRWQHVSWQSFRLTEPGTPALQKIWEYSGFSTPECAVYDEKRDLLYIGNINGTSPEGGYDGDGFVSKIGVDGRMIKLDWVSGLDDPKGMDLQEDTLWVNDKHHIIKIDVRLGTIIEKIKVPNVVFLNDISVAPDGVIYSNDADGHQMFKIENGELELFWEDTEKGRPNGVFAEADRLLVATTNSHRLFALDRNTKKITTIKEDIGRGDGIEAIGDGGYLITDYEGRVFHLAANGEWTTLIDSRGWKHTADLEYIKGKKLLVIPSHKNNTVQGFLLKGG